MISHRKLMTNIPFRIRNIMNHFHYLLFIFTILKQEKLFLYYNMKTRMYISIILSGIVTYVSPLFMVIESEIQVLFNYMKYVMRKLFPNQNISKKHEKVLYYHVFLNHIFLHLENMLI
jgi:hypothetical protein